MEEARTTPSWKHYFMYTIGFSVSSIRPSLALVGPSLPPSVLLTRGLERRTPKRVTWLVHLSARAGKRAIFKAYLREHRTRRRQAEPWRL